MNIIQDKTTFLLRTKKKLILLLALTLASGVMGTSSAGATVTVTPPVSPIQVSEVASGTWSFDVDSSTVFSTDSPTMSFSIVGGN